MKSIISLIPTLFTSMNLLFGFISISYAFQGQFKTAGLFIIFGTIWDLLDGKLARLLNVSNAIGKELDSFSDFLTFGIAPSFLVYNMTIQHFQDQTMTLIVFLICFLYTLSAALRLAIFNIGTYYKNVHKKDPTNFIGAPSTFAGLTIATLAAYESFYHGILYENMMYFDQMPYFMLATTLFLAIAMLLPVEYPRFLKIYFNYKDKQSAILTTVLLILLFLFSRIVFLSTIMGTMIVPIFIALFRKCCCSKTKA